MKTHSVMGRMILVGMLLSMAIVGYAQEPISPELSARDPVLHEIFSTFGFEARPTDPNLVANWRYEKIYISGDFSSTTVRYMGLRADGSFYSGNRLLFSSDAGTGDTGQGPGDRGRWGASNKKLTLIWDDGSYAEYGYYVEGAAGSRQMLLKTRDGEKELWEEVR